MLGQVLSHETGTSATTPGTTNSGGGNNRVGKGVDSLFYTLAAPSGGEFIEKVKQLKAQCQAINEANGSNGQPLETEYVFNGQQLAVMPYSRAGWAAILQNEWLTVEVGGNKLFGCDAHIRLSAKLLWSDELEKLTDVAMAWVFAHFGADAKVQTSEIHLAVDVTGTDWSDELNGLKHCLVRRARSASIVERSDRLETLAIGDRAGKISCSIYNKTAEIRRSGKTWFHDIWTRNGWNGQDAVWRVEFRIRRSGLRELAHGEGVSCPYTLLDAVAGLWAYLTALWMRHVRLSKLDSTHEQMSRAEISDWWACVAAPWDGEDVAADTRLHVRKFDEEKLMVQSIGCGLAALSRRIDVSSYTEEDFWRIWWLSVDRWLARKQLSIQQAIAQYSLRYVAGG